MSKTASIPLIEETFTNELSLSKRQSKIEQEYQRLLDSLGIQLTAEHGLENLYKNIVEAAVAIMCSQYGTMQILHPDPGNIGKLKIVASHGFTPEAEKFWEWVYHYTGSSCGEVLRTRRRVVVPDYRECEFMKDSPTLSVFIEGGVLAAQSTPLYSRSGKLLGMVSTHWSGPYMPPQAHLDTLDILARQVADIVEPYVTV